MMDGDGAWLAEVAGGIPGSVRYSGVAPAKISDGNFAKPPNLDRD